MKSKKFAFFLFFFGLGLLLLSYASAEKNNFNNLSVIVYTFLITVFLAAQLWAFVFSQISYSKEIEKVKLKILEIEKDPSKPLLCLVCGVDSKPVLTLFIWLVGAIVIGFISFLAWGILTGKFSDHKSNSLIPLRKEYQDE